MLKQVAGSQKNQVALAGLAMLAGANEVGMRDIVMELITGITALVVGIQGLLDWKWGSKSDGTGKFAAAIPTIPG